MSVLPGMKARVTMTAIGGFLLVAPLSTEPGYWRTSTGTEGRRCAFTAPDSSSALAQKAASRGAMLMQIGKYPDTTGNGPYPATYAMAPNGMEDVVYQPKDLAAVKGKLGVYIWGNGGCGYDGTSARFHLIEIASHGYVRDGSGRDRERSSGANAPADGAQRPAPVPAE